MVCLKMFWYKIVFLKSIFTHKYMPASEYMFVCAFLRETDGERHNN